MKNKKHLNLKIIILIVVLCSASFCVGFYYGAETTLNYGVDIILKLMEKEKISIDVDKEMLRQGILQFKNHIGGCVFLE